MHQLIRLADEPTETAPFSGHFESIGDTVVSGLATTLREQSGT